MGSLIAAARCNQLMRKRNLVREGWSGIDVRDDRRAARCLAEASCAIEARAAAALTPRVSF